jgi:hypothetical protein
MTHAASRATHRSSGTRPVGRRSLKPGTRWPLFVALLGQAVLSLTLLSRPLVLDESTYIDAGRVEIAHWLHGARTLPYARVFSGAPVIYPPLSGAMNGVGGLAAARLLSLCFMLAATALLYSAARQLLGTRVSIIAAVVFGTTSAAQYLGVLATFDALALMLLAAAAWFAVRSGDAAGQRRLLLLTAMCGLLAAANAVKYASALWDPVVIAMAALADVRHCNWGRRLATGAACSAGVLGLLAIAALIAGPSYWQGILFSTVNRTTDNRIQVVAILGSAARWVGLVAVLAVLGAVALTRSARDWSLKAMGWLLAAAVFLAPAEQARIGVAISLFKHVGFGAWFAAIPAGYGISEAVSTVAARRASFSLWAKVSSALVVIVALAMVVVGVYGAQGTNRTPPAYPIAVIARLKPILRTSTGPLLADTPNPIIYFTHISPFRWRNTYDFSYRDPVTGRRMYGIPAYVDAIQHHYFSIVILRSNRENKPIDQAVLTSLRHNRSYHLIILPASTRSPGKRRAWPVVLVWYYTSTPTG